jgi:hypothetical protein
MGGREKQSQDGNDEKVSVRQRGVRHSWVRLRLLLAPRGLRDSKARIGMWDRSLAKCSTSASALRGRKTGVILGRG